MPKKTFSFAAPTPINGISTKAKTKNSEYNAFISRHLV
jgi:hypothetical protein